MNVRHYGWPVSPYSAKTRSYLRFKQVPFQDREPSILRLSTSIRRAVGRMIMPTVRLPDGRWLQDTSDIIDHFESASPERSIAPPGATQRLASSLLELFGDEWLPMAALHYRWNVAENAAFARAEFGRYGLPFAPGFLARRVVGPMADKMGSYRGVLGITAATIPAIEETVRVVIAALQDQLSRTPFVLGGQPCLGDFALYGPLWAHIYRDPGSTHLFRDAPAVVGWMDRLGQGAVVQGAFLGDDQVPEALDPLFRLILEDQLPWVRTLVAAIDAYCDDNQDAKRVPRSLGTAAFSIRGATAERKLVTFVQYKAQRARRAFEGAAGAADPWLVRVAGEAVEVPAVAHPFERRNFKTVLA
jgi:glutathione S-transferase